MARIVAIDDQDDILKVIKNGLERDGHTVSTYSSADAVIIDQLKHFDLMLLDIMMPGTNGIEFCKKIRNRVDYPIIFLTAKTLEKDILLGLEIGADDYIVKPFRIAELRARVKAHMRRETRDRHNTLPFDTYIFDLDAKGIIKDGEVIALTRSEYQICEYLAKNKGQVFSREQIYEAVFGIYGESEDSTIATHISNIRVKLEAHDITAVKTVWGEGYKWE